MSDRGKSPRTSNLAMPCQESINWKISVKLGIGLLMCVVLFAACGGSSPSASDVVATVEAPAIQEITDKITPSPETQSAEETKVAASVPVATATPTDVVKATQPIPTIVPVATQVPGTPILGVTVAPSPATINPVSSDSCEVLTGNDKATCEEMMKSGTDVGNIVADPCAPYSGAAKDMCQQMAGAGTGSQHEPGSGGDSGTSNPCEQFTGDNKARCEKTIANDPTFGSSGPNTVPGGPPPGQSAESGQAESPPVDPKNPPRIAIYNFADLEPQKHITKIRAVYGHDYTYGDDEHDPSGKSCMSQKHYFEAYTFSQRYDSNFGSYNTRGNINFYAPADGDLLDIKSNQITEGTEYQFHLYSKEYPRIVFGFHHVDMLEPLRNGGSVTAGERLGTIIRNNGQTEIATWVMLGKGQLEYISFFDVMSDEVFAQYQARGIQSRSQMSISAEDRAANPVACYREGPDLEKFIPNMPELAFNEWQLSTDNWVSLAP